MWLPINWLVAEFVIGLTSTWYIIPRLKSMFIKKGISGKDMSKNYENVDETNIPKIPEAQGVITGCIFLMLTIVMIPFTLVNEDGTSIITRNSPDIEDVQELQLLFPSLLLTYRQLLQLGMALLSICCMVLLGFADDVLDLKWRHKIFLPTIASLPILVVYYITTNRTEIALPLVLRPWIGSTIDLGVLYYIYMGMLAIFCTNAINILAGINGLEVGQSVIIAVSIMIFNFGEMNGLLGEYHKFSLYFLCPYLSTTIPLLWYNWYPSQVFPGDTFCYFSGMTFAVVAILGHFSKTLLLFFIPQVINFLYSVPQLFHILPCPRHRLPRYNSVTNKVEMSLTIENMSKLGKIGQFLIGVMKLLRIAYVEEYEEDGTNYVKFNNLTLINFMLKLFGPLHERTLTIVLLAFQILCSCLAFTIRYPLALLFYGEIVA